MTARILVLIRGKTGAQERPYNMRATIGYSRQLSDGGRHVGNRKA